jgi:ABC-type nitrate/sulfonate/bicarbonate transport system substrate-binding protein
LRIGFIPVADCAPLLVARELDLFQKHGVKVEFSCEVGWATIREKLLYGQVDAAHALAGFAFALNLGLDCPPLPVEVPFIFNQHGNAITLSVDLWNRGVRDARTLKKLVQSTSRRITLAMVSSFSSHHFLLRDWLRSGGINPDRDVRVVPLPPTQMASSLKNGLIDGFCVGEPWNSVAVCGGYGWVAATSRDLSLHHPEKALLVSSVFAGSHQAELSALVGALLEASEWCDRPQNRPQVADILHSSGYFRCEKEALRRSLVGPFETGTGTTQDASIFHIFSGSGVNESTPTKGAWIMNQLLRHNVLPTERQAEALALLPRCWRTPGTRLSNRKTSKKLATV